MYSKGEGVERDLQQAEAWHKMAADLGDEDAQFDVAQRYKNGDGLPMDFEQAAFWYEKSANGGNVSAMASLASAYDDGIGIPKDDKAASRWYEKAALEGDTESQFIIATRYEGQLDFCAILVKLFSFTYSLPRNHIVKPAIVWPDYMIKGSHRRKSGRSRKMVSAGGIFRPWPGPGTMGRMYMLGRGVDKDIIQAREFLAIAAEKGDDVSQYLLAEFYDTGEGLLEDDTLAAKFYKLSADQGYALAQYRLVIIRPDAA